MALASATDLVNLLGITSGQSTSDAWVARLAAAEAMVNSYLGRSIESAERTEYYDGPGTEFLQLLQFPVTAIGSIYVDETRAWGSESLIASTEYFLHEAGVTGVVERLRAVWPSRRARYDGNLAADWRPGQGNIKVVYTAGYASVPAGIKAAVCFTARQLQAMGSSGALMSSEGHDGYTYSLDWNGGSTNEYNAITPTVANLLRPYRRIAVR